LAGQSSSGDRLRDEGYAVVRRAIDPVRCVALGREITGEYQRLERDGWRFVGPGRAAGNLNISLGSHGGFLLEALAPLRAEVAAALGADLVPTRLAGNYNLPDSVVQDFHRDSIDAATVIVANVGLTEGNDANGPIEIVPGSAGLSGYARFYREGWPKRAIRLPLAPGDVLLRRAQLWHRGTANRASQARPMAALLMTERGLEPPASIPEGPVQFTGNRFYGRFPATQEWLAVRASWLPHAVRYLRSWRE
jgi:hypothetical protein